MVPGIIGGTAIPGSTAATGTDRGAGPKPGVDGGNAVHLECTLRYTYVTSIIVDHNNYQSYLFHVSDWHS